MLRGPSDYGLAAARHEWSPPPGSLAELGPTRLCGDVHLLFPLLPLAYFEELAPQTQVADSVACAFCAPRCAVRIRNRSADKQTGSLGGLFRRDLGITCRMLTIRASPTLSRRHFHPRPGYGILHGCAVFDFAGHFWWLIFRSMVRSAAPYGRDRGQRAAAQRRLERYRHHSTDQVALAEAFRREVRTNDAGYTRV